MVAATTEKAAKRRPSNKAALDRSLKAWRDDEKLLTEHDALISMAKNLALSVDEHPTNTDLLRELRLVLKELRESIEHSGGDGGGEYQEFVLRVRTPGAAEE